MAKKKTETESSGGDQLTEIQQERIQKSIELMAKTKPMAIDAILPYQRNQKDHPEEQVRNLANSLRRFGWRQPVVIDERNVIVIGHGRVLGAKMLGLKEVPVISASDLTEDEIRELRIVDNKTNESAWNEYLDEDVQELSFEGFDFDFGENLSGGGYCRRGRRRRLPGRTPGRPSGGARRYLSTWSTPIDVRRQHDPGRCREAA